MYVYIRDNHPETIKEAIPGGIAFLTETKELKINFYFYPDRVEIEEEDITIYPLPKLVGDITKEIISHREVEYYALLLEIKELLEEKAGE